MNHMFKAKLLVDENYYKRHRRQLWMMILASVPIGLAVNFYKFPAWVSVLILLSVGIFFYLNLQNQKKLIKSISSKFIQCSNNSIQILSTEALTPTKHIELSALDAITVPIQINIPDESIRDIAATLSGKQRKQYIIIEQKGENIRYDFLVESYYMLTQLENVIKQWVKSGLAIYRI